MVSRSIKKALAAPPGLFREIPIPEINRAMGFIKAWANNRYKVSIALQPFEGRLVTKMLVSRIDDKPIPNHWSELQRLKNHFLGEEVVAVEFYPKASKLVDLANVYWLWVLPELQDFGL
jgi:hypothetical protein